MGVPGNLNPPSTKVPVEANAWLSKPNPVR
jgi:hypothetical protein